MGQQRIRRRRRHGFRGFRKPNAAIATLTSLTVILLLIWGGLYWKESSERKLIVNASGVAEGEQASTTGETITTVEQSNDKSGVTGEVPQSPEAAEPAQETVAKPETQIPAKSESHSTSPNNSPSTKETESPSAIQTDPRISPAQKYEQEIIQVQSMCTKDMKEVLSGAESSIQQLDKKDPFAVQALMEKLTKELAAAESKCDSKFQEVSLNAENDSVSPKVIEGWKQTFIDLKDKLHEESKAKLQQLMGG
jgi:hypothetical protein